MTDLIALTLNPDINWYLNNNKKIPHPHTQKGHLYSSMTYTNSKLWQSHFVLKRSLLFRARSLNLLASCLFIPCAQNCSHFYCASLFPQTSFVVPYPNVNQCFDRYLDSILLLKKEVVVTGAQVLHLLLGCGLSLVHVGGLVLLVPQLLRLAGGASSFFSSTW